MQTEPEPSNRPAERPNIFNRLFTLLLFSRRAIPVVLLAIITAVILSAMPPVGRQVLLASLYANRLLVLLLIFFGLLLISLLWSSGQTLDAWLFQYVNQHNYRTALTDRIMFWITQIGNGAFALALALIVFLFNLRRMAMELVLGTVTLWMVVEAVKALTERSRPFLLLSDANIIGWRERGKSFPSGHTSQAFFLATLISHNASAGALANLSLFALAVMVGFSRVYVGVHYPRDVLAGAILGSFWGILFSVLQVYWIGWF
jgi:membrane-associated phospholipid phosphatase